MKKKMVLLPLLVIAVALVLTIVLIKSRRLPTPHETPHLGPLVEVMPLTLTDRQVVVSGSGTVQPRFEVSITPQVKGRVSEISPRMVAGGTFKKGELLFAIEDVDYRLAVELARSDLAQAELELQRNENLAEVARKEWYALNGADAEPPDPLVVYQPQLQSAIARRDAAIAGISQAELNLKRTRIEAPFNCYVRSEQVEIGQFVNAGSPVATLAGTDQVEIEVPLPVDELNWLQVPGVGQTRRGSPAQVMLKSGELVLSWQGAISRALGEIDPRNRMARVVVTVDDPFQLGEREATLLDNLLPGMFVEVRLQGGQIGNVVVVPRGALHDDDTLWLVDDRNRLQIRTVDVVRRERDVILVRGGLTEGETLVLTDVTGAADGMLLRPQLPEADQ